MSIRLYLAPLLLLAAAPVQAASPRPAPDQTESLQLACDAINVAGQLDHAILKDLEPAHSLDAAAVVLERHKVKFNRTHNVMMLSNAPSAMVREIFRLPQGEPIVLPNGEDTTICVPRPSADSI
ncbi:hypothetical protein [Sphingomonas sp. MMS24-J13]|uniref:hypothetical protein n=1 Tax=Sphingomonas sp. MMS24-J13 TaxID=3238686 RepID=UPI0038517D7C